jgi:hypothetical protein
LYAYRALSEVKTAEKWGSRDTLGDHHFYIDYRHLRAIFRGENIKFPFYHFMPIEVKTAL